MISDLSTIELLLGAATLCVFVISILLTNSWQSSYSDRMGQRIQYATARQLASRSSGQATNQHSSLVRADHSTSSISRILRSTFPALPDLPSALARANISWSVNQLLLILIGLCAVFSGLVNYIFHWNLVFIVIVMLPFHILLLYLFLRSRISRRERAFVSLFPDAIELIIRSVKSGLPISEAIGAIAKEIDEPVRSVFRGISESLKIGVNLTDALWLEAGKLGIQEFKFFAISLTIQQETGGNLSEILQNLSNMIRRREQVKLKVRAMSSEARASAMIIGSLPFIMAGLIYIVNRDYIMILFTDPRGWIALSIAGTSMTLGITIIAKMVRFEI